MGNAYQILKPTQTLPIDTADTTNPDVTLVAAEQVFTFTVVGLKPLTVHKFYWNNSDRTNKTKDLTNQTTSLLTSSSSGELHFEFYYDSTIDRTTTYSTFIQNNDSLNRPVGSNSIKVINADETSWAIDNIDGVTTNVIGTPTKTFIDLALPSDGPRTGKPPHEF